MTTDDQRTPNNDPAAHMTDERRRYATFSDADLAAALRQYATSPEGYHWTERAALLTAAAERLDLSEPIELHRHTPHWYSQLGAAHGHAGYCTVAEIRDAERTHWEPPQHEPQPPNMMP